MENSERNNLFISGEPASLNLGTAVDPGGNTFRNADGTDWAVRDARGGNASSPVLYLYGNTFDTKNGSSPKPSGAGQVCGPDYRYADSQAAAPLAFLNIQNGVCAEF